MNKCKTVKFYLFGDSICYGQLVSSYKTWANILATSLAGLSSKKKKFLIQNAGVNGNTTRQALERLHYDVTSHNPDYVLIQFGMNDCNYWHTDKGLPRVTPDAFKANLEEIVHKCLAAGVKHCFFNTNHPSTKGFKSGSVKNHDKSNREYNKHIRDITKKMHLKGMPVSLCDIERHWLNHLKVNDNFKLQDLLLEDGIHLSDTGHDLYVSYLIPVILSHIQDAEKT